MKLLGIAKVLLLSWPGFICTSASSPKASGHGRDLITESGKRLFEHEDVPCDPSVVGSEAACHDIRIPTAGVADYPLDAPEVTIPTDGSPWGVHVTPGHPAGNYIVTWMRGEATVGPPTSLNRDIPSGFVELTPEDAALHHATRRFFSRPTSYARRYTRLPAARNFSYTSPEIHHAVVAGLVPGTAYLYHVGHDAGPLSPVLRFTTLPEPESAAAFPFRLGLMADVGQTRNSSATMRQMLAHSPHAALNAGDLAYADQYSFFDAARPGGGGGTHQRRWDTFSRLWEPLMSAVPTLHAVGNHEIEADGVDARISADTESFRYPQDYPFQAFAARFPSPTQTHFGAIDGNLYYSTDIGPAHVVVLNNYVPFHQGTRQHSWFISDLQSFDRRRTPWLIVMVHASIYHTYQVHYKEMECFRETYEELFYNHGVDLVVSGHVHAYERTHPVYRYKLDTCAPAYLTVGDGGNVEGLYRNFVDEVNPNTGKTYCEAADPNSMAKDGYGPWYQRQVQPSGCTTISFQDRDVYSDASPTPEGLVVNDNDPSKFWCQNSQPRWSAHRDPSFGHAMLYIESATVAHLKWYRNVDGGTKVADSVTFERLESCPNSGSVHKGDNRHSNAGTGSNNGIPMVLVVVVALLIVLLIFVSVISIMQCLGCIGTHEMWNAHKFVVMEDNADSTLNEL